MIHEGLVGPQGFSGDPRAPGTAAGPLGAYGMPGGDFEINMNGQKPGELLTTKYY